MQFAKVDHPTCELDCCMASSYLSDDSESDFTLVIEKVGWLNRTWSNGDNASQFMSDPVLTESDFPDYCDDQDFSASSPDSLVILQQDRGRYSRT